MEITVEDLIKKLKKMPEKHKININVDNCYSSSIKSIYIDEYEKKNGREIVTIRV